MGLTDNTLHIPPMTINETPIISIEAMAQTIADLQRRLADVEAQLAAFQPRPPKQPAEPRRHRGPRKPESWSEHKRGDAEFLRPHIARAMSGRKGKYTSAEVAQLARIDDSRATLISIGIVLRGWGLSMGKSGSRHPWTFDGRELI